MSDVTEGTQEVTGQQETQEQQKPDVIEVLAKKLGYKDKEEFGGDESKWVDPHEFVAKRFERLTDRNNDTTKKVFELEKTLKAVSGHITKVEKLAYEKAIADLKREKRVAVADGDVEAAEALDEQLDMVKQSMAQAPAKVDDAPAPPPEIVEWEKENGKWFYADPEISDFGIAHMQTFMARHPEATPAQGLESMEKAVKRAFPDKFENPERKKPSAVETGGDSTKASSTKKYTRADLSEEQRMAHDTFVRQGHLTSEAYIKSLVELGEIGGKK